MTSVCYCTALRNAARRVAAVYDEALAPVGVNIAQFALLRAIARDTPVALTELGKRTELDRSTVGRNVRVLARMGLVALGRGKDQREAPVSLTPAGHQALKDGSPLWEGVQQTIERQMAGLGAQDLRQTLSSL